EWLRSEQINAVLSMSQNTRWADVLDVKVIGGRGYADKSVINALQRALDEARVTNHAFGTDGGTGGLQVSFSLSDTIKKLENTFNIDVSGLPAVELSPQQPIREVTGSLVQGTEQREMTIHPSLVQSTLRRSID